MLVLLLGAMPGTVLPRDESVDDRDPSDRPDEVAWAEDGVFSVETFEGDGELDEPTAELVAGSQAPPTSDESSAPVVGALNASGIPEIALRAYRAAQATMAATDPGCGLRWSLVAAIGRVESNHGRFGGAQLRADGTTTRPIRGIPLDGRPGVATIRDTDNGALDGDSVYDRAVGPMQFIPSSWRFAGADGNGDGREDPDNIFDAALAAAGYLCAGDTDLRDPDQRAAAVFRYNHSDEYVSVVLALAEQYERGVRSLPTEPAAPGGPSLPSPQLPPGSVTQPPFGRDPAPPSRPPTTTTTTRPSTTTTTSPTTTTPSSTTTTTAPCPTTTTTVPDPSSTTTTTTTTTVPDPSSTTTTAPCPTTTTRGSDPSTTTTTTTTAPVQAGVLAGGLVVLPLYLLLRRRRAGVSG